MLNAVVVAKTLGATVIVTGAEVEGSSALLPP
jgi:hypothetical protein